MVGVKSQRSLPASTKSARQAAKSVRQTANPEEVPSDMPAEILEENYGLEGGFPELPEPPPGMAGPSGMTG